MGKFTTAEAFGTILLDPAARTNLAGIIESDPDGPIARLVAAGTHPDLHIIRKELALHADNAQLRNRKLTNIPVDVLRQFMIGGRTADDHHHEPIAFHTPKMNHGKVFIIDEAELLDITAQNVLLKTLEEPPPQTYIFLISARPERLLPTIRSRAQLVRFRALEPDAMQTWIARSTAFEGAASGGMDDDVQHWILDYADGSPGRALTAALHGIHRWELELRPMFAQLMRQRFPADMGESLAGFVEAFATATVKASPKSSKDAANKTGARHLFHLLGSMLRRQLRDAAHGIGPVEPVLKSIDAIQDAESSLASNVNLKQVLEHLTAEFATAWSTANQAGSPAEHVMGASS